MHRSLFNTQYWDESHSPTLITQNSNEQSEGMIILDEGKSTKWLSHSVPEYRDNFVFFMNRTVVGSDKKVSNSTYFNQILFLASDLESNNHIGGYLGIGPFPNPDYDY